MTLTTGQLLAQRYRLERRIAVGGMGEVWQAADTRLDRQVAVKVLKAELSGDPEFRDRFHTEARLTASLNHPGIAAVHDYGETQPATANSPASGAFLVMELVDGDSLATILLRSPRLSVDRTLDILGQAGDGLQAAHERGLVHRDIKPANILITPAGRVKLTDFGIAKAADAAAVTRQGIVMGTPYYIAPEQASGQGAGPASDIYSLGVVGYECLAGQRPFPADSAIAVVLKHLHEPPPPLSAEVPAQVRALIETTLAKDPRLRYGTGGEFAAAIAAVQAGRRPPPPAGGAGTAVLGRHPSQTAVLPSAAQSGPYPLPRPAGYGPPRRSDGRSTTRGVAVALFVVLLLVLAGYLIRDTVLPTDANPVAGESTSAEPEPTTTEPEPTPEQIPEPTSAAEEPELITIFLPEYILQPADEAAALAESKGLQPQVVDQDGAEVGPESQPNCRIIRVDPAFGSVPPGSSITLICRRGL